MRSHIFPLFSAMHESVHRTELSRNVKCQAIWGMAEQKFKKITSLANEIEPLLTLPWQPLTGQHTVTHIPAIIFNAHLTPYAEHPSFLMEDYAMHYTPTLS
jgi:hypothetical protein